MKNLLRTVSVILIVSTLVLVFSGCGKETENTSDVPDSDLSVFGDFTAKDLDGNTVTQDIFAQNKITMVNIWATFCGPCINEMPDLGELAAEYADKGVGVVGIPVDITDRIGAVDETLFNEAVDIVDKTKADYTHIVPTGEMFEKKLNDVFSVPETIFVDSEGNQIGEPYIGARTKSQWEAIINDLLSDVK